MKEIHRISFYSTSFSRDRIKVGQFSGFVCHGRAWSRRNRVCQESEYVSRWAEAAKQKRRWEARGHTWWPSGCTWTPPPPHERRWTLTGWASGGSRPILECHAPPLPASAGSSSSPGESSRRESGNACVCRPITASWSSPSSGPSSGRSCAAVIEAFSLLSKRGEDHFAFSLDQRDTCFRGKIV